MGAAAGASSAVGPAAGPSVYSLPGAGGEEAPVSGEEASEGEAAGVEVGVAEALGEEEPVGLDADDLGADDSEPFGTGAAEGDDDGVVGEDFGVGEALGELVGASSAWAATTPATAMQTKAKTINLRAIIT
ncbi:hypothetical protein F2P56_000529 [Juglans regia]|uniref:Uncharacterized protein n=1 Tax=Juglans regia TaxID=51240 RepID=A0A833XXB3_JUGRE|nr:hypothetical protein F2P56_000529 [Juglans regia]